MAYRTRRRTTRARSTSRTRRSSGRSNYRSRASSSRRSSSRRSYRGGSGTLRIELVTSPAGGVSRPEMMGLKPATAPRKNPTF